MAYIQERPSYRVTIRVDGDRHPSRVFQELKKAKAWEKAQLASARAKSLDLLEPPSKLKRQIKYRVQVRVKGFPTQTATFERKTDASNWGQQTESDIRRGKYFDTAEAKKRTLAEMIDRYTEDVLDPMEGVVSPPEGLKDWGKTKALLKYWREELGPYSLSEITPARIVQKRDELASGTTYRGTRRSPSTCNRYLGALSQVFSTAVKDWNWVGENPVRKVSKLKEPRGRVRFLSEDERKNLLKACKESSDRRLYPLVVVAISTGARQGELLSLRWQDVSFERGLAFLLDTKNDERRAVPITGHAMEVFREMKKVRRADTDLVFVNPRGRTTGFPQRAWEKALRDAEIEDFRFHDLRHSAASYLAMNGATLAEIAEVLGHKTLAMVKRYSHLTEQHTSKVVARMNEQIFGAGE